MTTLKAIWDTPDGQDLPQITVTVQAVSEPKTVNLTTGGSFVKQEATATDEDGAPILLEWSKPEPPLVEGEELSLVYSKFHTYNGTRSIRVSGKQVKRQNPPGTLPPPHPEGPPPSGHAGRPAAAPPPMSAPAPATSAPPSVPMLPPGAVTVFDILGALPGWLNSIEKAMAMRDGEGPERPPYTADNVISIACSLVIAASKGDLKIDDIPF